MRLFANNKGVTIVELLVVLPILVVSAFFLVYLFSSQYTVYNTQTAEFAITSHARVTLDEIDIYVRQARRVVASHLTHVTDSQTLALQLQSIDASSQILVGTYDYAVFYISDGKLMEQIYVGAGSSRIATTKTLAENVDMANFSFAYNNPDYSLVTEVQTNIALAQNIGTQARSVAVSSKAKLRNY